MRSYPRHVLSVLPQPLGYDREKCRHSDSNRDCPVPKTGASYQLGYDGVSALGRTRTCIRPVRSRVLHPIKLLAHRDAGGI